MATRIILLFFIVFILSCSSKFNRVKTVFVPGKYTSHKLSKSERLAYIDKFGNHFGVSFDCVLDIRNDSTYHIGYCQRKIVYKGKWKLDGDSIVLYKSTNVIKNIPVDDVKVYYNGYGDIFMPFREKPGLPRTYTILRIGGEQFDGILSDSAK